MTAVHSRIVRLRRVLGQDGNFLLEFLAYAATRNTFLQESIYPTGYRAVNSRGGREGLRHYLRLQ